MRECAGARAWRWPVAPTPVREQVQALVAGVASIAAGNLLGMYLHGSLAMGGFNPARSDFDILVVTRDRVDGSFVRDMEARIVRAIGR